MQQSHLDFRNYFNHLTLSASAGKTAFFFSSTNPMKTPTANKEHVFILNITPTHWMFSSNVDTYYPSDQEHKCVLIDGWKRWSCVCSAASKMDFGYFYIRPFISCCYRFISPVEARGESGCFWYFHGNRKTPVLSFRLIYYITGVYSVLLSKRKVHLVQKLQLHVCDVRPLTSILWTSDCNGRRGFESEPRRWISKVLNVDRGDVVCPGKHSITRAVSHEGTCWSVVTFRVRQQ